MNELYFILPILSVIIIPMLAFAFAMDKRHKEHEIEMAKLGYIWSPAQWLKEEEEDKSK